jgi:hypothetical protein
MQYVNVYETYQCYGGPEEGGWWFMAGELVECLGPMSKVEAEAAAKAIRKGDECKVKSEYLMGYNSTDGKDPDGVPDDDYIMVGGAWGYVDLQVLVRDEVGVEYFPKERPRYE